MDNIIKSSDMWDKPIVPTSDSPNEACPICGYDCCHILDVCKDSGVSSAKSGNVVITFWGECGHYWAKIFNAHKGYVYLDIVEFKVGANVIKPNESDV